MDLKYSPFHLEFKHPFGVSSNTRKETLSVFIKLQQNGYTGYGEACLPVYLGESHENTVLFFEQVKPLFKTVSLSTPTEEVLNRVDRLSPGNNAAKAAIDMALNDLQGKLAGKPYYQMVGLEKSSPKATSFTIGIDLPEKLEQKIKEASEFPILKIKAGTPNDKKLIALIRRFTEKPLYVDVNQGWADKHRALEMIRWLKDQRVVLVEQPLPKEMKEDMRWLTERSPLPTIADESVKRLADLKQLEGSFNGVNIKLMKCTGLGEALKMIGYCRKEGLNILLGCMAESSCGTSAMAQLMGLADHIDLDAPLLYLNDPFTGIGYQDGKVHLNENPGIGVELKPALQELL